MAEMMISVLLDAPRSIVSAVDRLKFPIPPGGFVAGGYLRDAMAGFEPKDVDYFFTTPSALYSASRDLADRGARFLYATKNAVGLTLEGSRIELVSAHFADAITCLSAFDFVANCAAVTGDGRYIRHPAFERDAIWRQLCILNRAQSNKATRLESRGWKFCGTREDLVDGATLYG